jgi:elongation factor Ts
MSAITAAAVKELREITGVAMMDCKKALVECNGELEEAKEFLRKKGQAKALKKSSRETREGAIGIHINGSKSSGAIVKLACETDFVARNESFQALLESLGGQILSQGSDSILDQQLVDAEGTVQDLINAKVAELGENMQLLDSSRLDANQGHIGGYVHMTGKIGVIVCLETSEVSDDPQIEQLAKNLAMHIAASPAEAVREDQVDTALISKEREVFSAQALESGKPKEIIAKMIEGRIKKFLKEICVESQPFVKDPQKSVSQLVKEVSKETGVEIRLESFVKYQF